MRTWFRWSAVAVVGMWSLLGHAQEDTALDGRLQALAAAHHGKLAVFATNLKTGQTAALQPDTPVQTASVIKLTVLFEALEQVRAGKVSFEDPITLKAEDIVTGSGLLQLLDTPQTLTFKDVLTMMVVVSDNTGTNLAIDHLGLRNVDDRIVALGLKNTWLYKKIYKPAEGPMPADQKQFGLGKTTAREMASVMTRLVQCDLNMPSTTHAAPTAADRKLCGSAMHMLRNQFYRETIPRYLESKDTSETESAIGNKTGSLDAVRNDVAAVDTPQGTIIVSAFTWDNQDQGWSVDNAAEVLLAHVGKAVVDAWAPGAFK